MKIQTLKPQHFPMTSLRVAFVSNSSLGTPMLKLIFCECIVETEDIRAQLAAKGEFYKSFKVTNMFSFS